MPVSRRVHSSIDSIDIDKMIIMIIIMIIIYSGGTWYKRVFKIHSVSHFAMILSLGCLGLKWNKSYHKSYQILVDIDIPGVLKRVEQTNTL